MNRKEKGFTLIELIIVIVILSLLAVMAVARYMDAITDARKGVIHALAGSMESAVVLVHMKARLEGDTAAGTVTVTTGKGATATVNTTSKLVPTGRDDGIHLAIDYSNVGNKFTTASPVEDGDANNQNVTYSIADGAGAAIANCNVVYNEILTAGATQGTVTITATTSGC